MIHSLAKGAAWLGISKILSQAYFFCFTVYIANLLSPNDYALMGVAMIAIGLFELLTEFGLGDAVVQRKNISEDEITSVFWVATSIGAAICLTCILLSQSIESFFDKQGVAPIINALSIILLLRSVSIVPYKLIERKMRFRIKAVIDMISKFVSISIAGLFAYLGHGVWSLVYAHLINHTCIAVLSFVFEPVRPRIKVQFKNIVEMMAFGLNIIGLRFAWYLKGNIDKIIGGKFLDAFSFGFYSFGFKLTQNIERIIHNVMNIISLPVLSRAQDDDEKVNSRYLLLMKYCSLITFPIFLGGSILGKDIIELLFTENWLPIIGVFKIACFVTLFRMMNSVTENLFIAIGKPQYSLAANILSIIVLTASFLWGIRWGLEGLLLTWAIVFPALFFIWTYFALYYRKIKITTFLKNINPAILGSITMITGILLLKTAMIPKIDLAGRIGMAINLLALILAGGLIYISVAYLFDKTIISAVLKRAETKE